jgi:AbrB family looped-hinge helix DNA binding protein
MNAVISQKGQVTIPKAIRDDLGLTAGCLLDFKEDHGQIIVRKVMPQNPISAWRGRGKLPVGTSVNEYLTASRGEA